MPGTAVRAEQWIERRKLEPTHIEFSGEFPCRNEPAGVGAPKGRDTKRVIDSHRHVRRECCPARQHVARPDPATVARHTRVAIAVKAPGPNVRPVLQRALVITTMP